jgi:CubicO group peptidase (beta-lactamase class C family)
MVNPESVGMSSERLARIRPAVDRHIGEDKIAGAVTLLARRRQIVHFEAGGLMDRENDRPMQLDTLFRIYSMTKPITCVALMTLYEQGCFQLWDPVAKFIPPFGELQVCTDRQGSELTLVDLQRPVTVRDLLTHTSGLTYHFLEYGPVEEMYRETKVWSQKPLVEFVDDLAQLPLAFQPGTAWRYSYGHDVVARLVEIISGQPLDVYLRENLFHPLGMVDTGFCVPEGQAERLASMYGSRDVGECDTTATEWYELAMQGVNRLLACAEDSLESHPHNVFRGGTGLVSTASDYLRFSQMLLNNGELEGTRILSRKTVELMVTNHLLPALMPYEIQGSYSPGYGYGLGFRVLMDVGQCQMPGSVGEYGWSGAASTCFWVDPQEEFIGILMTQYQPSGLLPIDSDFRVAAYQAIVD